MAEVEETSEQLGFIAQDLDRSSEISFHLQLEMFIQQLREVHRNNGTIDNFHQLRITYPDRFEKLNQLFTAFYEVVKGNLEIYQLMQDYDFSAIKMAHKHFKFDPYIFKWIANIQEDINHANIQFRLRANSHGDYLRLFLENHRLSDHNEILQIFDNLLEKYYNEHNKLISIIDAAYSCFAMEQNEIGLKIIEKYYATNSKYYLIESLKTFGDLLGQNKYYFKLFFLLAHEKFPTRVVSGWVHDEFEFDEKMVDLFRIAITSEENHQAAIDILRHLYIIGFYAYMEEEFCYFFARQVIPSVFSSKEKNWRESYKRFPDTLQFVDDYFNVDDIFKAYLENQTDLDFDSSEREDLKDFICKCFFPFLVHFYFDPKYIEFATTYCNTKSNARVIQQLSRMAGVNPQTKNLYPNIGMLTLKEFCRILIRGLIMENSRTYQDFFRKIDALETEIPLETVKFLKFK